MKEKATKPLAIIFLLLFLGSHFLKAQDDELGVIFWSHDRNLEWEDFEGQPVVDTSAGFYLDLYIDQFNESGFFYSMNRFDRLSYVFKKSSYASEEIRNDDLLRYLNVYFDMAAYYSFKYVNQTAAARNSTNAVISRNSHLVGKAVAEEWRLESARFSAETEYGVQIEKLLNWEERIAELTATIIEPVIKDSENGFSFDLAIGKLLGHGEYKRLLTEPIVGLLSAELMLKPYVFAFGLSGGGQSVLESFSEGTNNFPIESEPNIMNLFIHGGYVIFDSKRFRVIPRIGVHFSNLRYPKDEIIDASVWSVSYTAAATVDVKIGSWSSRNQLMSARTELALRLGSYYFPVHVADHNISHTLLTAGLLWTIGGTSMSY